MKQMMQHRLSWPFRKPVDAVKLKVPNYYEIIKEPMDFGTIQKKLKQDEYSSAKECIKDFNRVFTNCYIFNQPDDEVVAAAKDLEKFFLAKLKDMPEIEWEVKSHCKYDAEGSTGREALGLQDHLSGFFSTSGVIQRRRRGVARLKVGAGGERRSIMGGEQKVEVRIGGTQNRPRMDKWIVRSQSEEHADFGQNMKQLNRHENKLKAQSEIQKDKGESEAPVSQKVLKKAKTHWKEKNNSKGFKSIVSKKASTIQQREARGAQSATREESDCIRQKLELKGSGSFARPRHSSHSNGALDPFLYSMMISIQEATRSHASMSSSAVKEVLLKHNMHQLAHKLDMIKDSMEVMQKTPQSSPNLVGEIKASVAKLEGSLVAGRHCGSKRSNVAEHSRRPYTDWGAMAARKKNNGNLVDKNMEEGSESQVGGRGVKQDIEDDISDLLASDGDELEGNER